MSDTTETTVSTETKKAPRPPRVTRKTPAPVLAGPPAVRHADGRVMALPGRPGVYPEVAETYGDGFVLELFCAGHQELHPAKAFSFLTKRGAGSGRATECRSAWTGRLAENKTRKAAGRTDLLPVPMVDEEHTLPKPEKAAPPKK